jgi:hypothetical protein
MTKVIIKDDDDDVFDSRGVLKDGATLTNRMFMKDGNPNPDLTPAQRVAAAVAATRAAMTSFDSSMHKPGFRYAADCGAAPTRFGVHDSTREDCYAARDREMADAWKTKTDRAPPAGSYPASEGDSCTINGEPGTLCVIDGHDGYLECVPNSDIDNDNDIDTGDSAKTPQQIRDAAYATYDSEISDAWRNK